MELKVILAEIENQLKENKMPINITRIIKLLYLIEVEYFKYRKKRLTNLKWRFYHYGPIPLEIYDYCKKNNIDIDNVYTNTGNIIKIIQMSEIYNRIIANTTEKRYILSLISRIVKSFGNMDIKELLDYVYFETEPMKNAKRGEYLDFTKVKDEEIFIPNDVTLSKETKKKLKDIKKKLSSLLKKDIEFKPLADRLYNKNGIDAEIKPINIKGEIVLG